MNRPDKRLMMIFTITLFAVMGVASLTPALPGVIEHFNIQPHEIGWLIAGFTLPGILLTPVTGILADRLGRKNVVVPSLLLFGLAGFSCFFAQNYSTLIILRIIQGIGASSLGTLNITLIGDLYSGSTRQAAMGYNASILSIGTAAYPIIGGALASIGWNFPFLLPLLAFPAGWWIAAKMEAYPSGDSRSIGRYLGSTWRNINRRQVWSLFLITFMIFVVLYGALLTYMPLLMKERLDAGPGRIGMIMALMSLVTAATASQSGKISLKLTPLRQIIISLGIYFTATLLCVQITSWITLIVPTILFGLGHGMMLPVVHNQLAGLAPMEERAAFLSANSVLTRTGQTIGPAFAGLLYIQAGYTGVFVSASAVIFIMILITLVLNRRL
jgi:MFS transporter, ACDE family, multidrug resistance protein